MSTKQFLRRLVVFNLVASLLHTTDNILFFERYPEPEWIDSPHTVALLWTIATPLLLFGYSLYTRSGQWRSRVCLILYSLCSLSVLGHYRYASPQALPFRINLLITLEALAATMLMISVVALQVGANRPTQESEKAT